VNSDPASLQNLRDIVQQPPVPWWPPAPGWWILFGLAVLVAGVLAIRGWRMWRRGAYRRAALREMESATNVAGIAEILKRTALVGFPRTDVAALSGSAWCQWLAETCGRQLPAAVADALTVGVFAKEDVVNVSEVRAFASDWIKSHVERNRAGKK